MSNAERFEIEEEPGPSRAVMLDRLLWHYVIPLLFGGLLGMLLVTVVWIGVSDIWTVNARLRQLEFQADVMARAHDRPCGPHCPLAGKGLR